MASRMIALALGIACLAWVPVLPPVSALVLLCAVLYFGRQHKVIALALCLTLGMAYGAGYGQYRLERLPAPELEGKDLRVLGRIASLPEYSPVDGGRYRFDFSVDAWLRDSTFSAPQSKNLRLSYRPTNHLPGQSPLTLKMGQQWELTVRIKRPRSYANPGAFDYAAWLVGRGSDASGYVRHARLISDSRADIRADLVLNLRQALLTFREGPILLALATGDRSRLSDEDWQLFRLSGTSHLMAISGLHIGIAAGIGWLLGRCLTILFKGPRCWVLQPVLALLLGGIYAWLAGFSLPTQRAFVMVCAGVLAVAAARHIGRWQAWSLALLIVLAINPLAGLQPGFWLSFFAVAVLLAIFEREGGWRSIWRAQLMLLVGLAPFTVFFFQQFSLLAFPVNLIAVPLFSFLVVPLVLLAVFTSLISQQLSLMLWTMADVIVCVFIDALEYLGAYQSYYLVERSLSTGSMVALCVMAVVIMLPKVFTARYLALLCLLALMQPPDSRPKRGDFNVDVLDVGQGLSVLVQTRNRSLLYDLGPSYRGGFNLAEAAVRPVLLHKGIRYLDKLIISHADNDHAGAYEAFLSAVPVGEFMSGAALPGARPCMSEQHWHWDGVDFSILSPTPALFEAAGVKNNSSCVLLIQSGEARLLLPGDIEATVERDLLALLHEPLTVLVAPHHGSKTSSSPEFVAHTQARWVIFSAGYKHHYGHPAFDVLERYRRQGSRLANTADSGMISLELGPNGVKYSDFFREKHRFYWNAYPN